MVMVFCSYSRITSREVRTEEYTRKIKDIKRPITRKVLSKLSFVWDGSVILSTRDTVINSMLKSTAAKVMRINSLSNTWKFLIQLSEQIPHFPYALRI